MSIVIHPDALRRIDGFANKLPQGVLLTGEKGVGLLTIARELLAGKNPVVVAPRLITKTSTIPQISTDIVRELYVTLRGKSIDEQVVIIDDADTMTLSAQNSLLKLLEEPPAAVRFILTSHHPEKLLPTVRSRVQPVHISRCTSQQSDELLESCKDLSSTEQRQVAFIAGGLPAEILRIANDKKYRERVIQATATAKQLLEASSGERVLRIAKMPTDRGNSLLVIEKMMQIVQLRPSMPGVQLLERLVIAYMRIQGNGNVRLQLAAAMV